MIVKGSTDKSIKWKGTDAGVAYNTWVSSENFDLAQNKIFSLNGINIADPVAQTIGPVNGTGTDDINLSGGGTPYALGSAVTGSSLTSLGTLNSLTVSGGTNPISFTHTGGAGVSINRSSKSLSFNCLLYTSPSPRDRVRSRMPSSA